MKLNLFEMMSVDTIMGERSNTQPYHKKRKIRQEGERKRVEGKESPERKTDREKERGGMSDFAAVFSLLSLLVPRGVPLW